MTIKKKLYINFGFILLGIMVLLFFVSIFAMMRERSAKTSAAATESVRFQMMQNRLTLANYLLSGDTRELDTLPCGAISSPSFSAMRRRRPPPRNRDALTKLDGLEKDWVERLCCKDDRQAQRRGPPAMLPLLIFRSSTSRKIRPAG